MPEHPSPVTINIFTAADPTHPVEGRSRPESGTVHRLLNLLIRPFCVVIDPPPSTSPNNPVRSYPKTGGTLAWIPEQSMLLHTLTVYNTDGTAQGTSVDLTPNTPNTATGAFSKQVDVSGLAVGTTYWFQVGVKIVSGVTQENFAHRFQVMITAAA